MREEMEAPSSAGASRDTSAHTGCDAAACWEFKA
jgi:hypothetical protein